MNEQHHAHHHHHRHPWPFLNDLENLGDEYLIRKAPHQLPHKWKDIIAKLLPIIALIIAIVSIPGILGGLLFVFGFPGYRMGDRGPYHGHRGAVYPIVLLQLLMTIAITALYFKAFEPLRKRQYIGWAYIFYAGLIGFAANLIDGGIIRAILGFILSMYLLFQAKELYH